MKRNVLRSWRPCGGSCAGTGCVRCRLARPVSGAFWRATVPAPSAGQWRTSPSRSAGVHPITRLPSALRTSWRNGSPRDEDASGGEGGLENRPGLQNRWELGQARGPPPAAQDSRGSTCRTPSRGGARGRCVRRRRPNGDGSFSPRGDGGSLDGDSGDGPGPLPPCRSWPGDPDGQDPCTDRRGASGWGGPDPASLHALTCGRLTAPLLGGNLSHYRGASRCLFWWGAACPPEGRGRRLDRRPPQGSGCRADPPPQPLPPGGVRLCGRRLRQGGRATPSLLDSERTAPGPTGNPATLWADYGDGGRDSGPIGPPGAVGPEAKRTAPGPGLPYSGGPSPPR